MHGIGWSPDIQNRGGSGGCQAGPLWPEKEGRRGRKRLFQTVIDRLLWESEHTAKPQVVGDGWGRKEGGDGGSALLLAARILLLFHGLSLFIVFLGFNYAPPQSILESFYPGDAQTTATRFKNSWS